MDNSVSTGAAAATPPLILIPSDSELVHRATSVLRWKIRYKLVRVEAEKGHVTLSGEVDLPSDIAAAEQTIRKLSGVLEVTNRITSSPRRRYPADL